MIRSYSTWLHRVNISGLCGILNAGSLDLLYWTNHNICRSKPLFHTLQCWLLSNWWRRSFCTLFGWWSVRTLLSLCYIYMYSKFRFFCFLITPFKFVTCTWRLNGSSSVSETYGNPCLANSQDFEVKEVEVDTKFLPLPFLATPLTALFCLSSYYWTFINGKMLRGLSQTPFF